MHYAGNVDYPRLLPRPSIYIPGLGLLFGTLLYAQAETTSLGQALAGIFGLAEGSSFADNVLEALIITAVVALNVAVVMRLSLKQQVYVSG
jgi:polar amino acid transport system permease protein